MFWTYFLICVCEESLKSVYHYQTAYNVKNYFHWIAPDVGSQDLYCPNCCRDIPAMTPGNCFPLLFVFVKDIEICCAFRALPFWSFDEYKHVKGHLYIEYNSKNRTADIVKQDTFEYYDLIHKSGYLSSFPSNICQFPNIVKIDLSMNKIRLLPDFGCLKHLDTLHMFSNEIERIHSYSFANLKDLRRANFENNKILSVQPGSLSYLPRSLMFVNFKHNYISTIDVRDMILKSYFGLIDLSNNRLSTITNIFNTSFVVDVVIGGGSIALNNNTLRHFFDLGKIGFPDETALKYAFKYMIDFRFNEWACDCYMWLYYLQKAGQAIPFFPHVGEPTCFSPPNLKGLSISHFKMQDKTADLLICNISAKDKCPMNCYCFRQPSEGRTMVNCSSTSRLSMPVYAPDYDDLDIDLSHNRISSFAYRKYLNQTFKIDLSYNQILLVDDIIFQIQKLTFIDLRHNDLDTIHESIRLKSPCSVLFGEIYIHCNCKMRWLEIWLEKGKIANCTINSVLCITESGYVELSSIRETCKVATGNTNSVLYGLFSSILFILLSSVYIYLKFGVEVYLVFRRSHLNFQRSAIRYSRRQDTVYKDIQGEFERFLVYISFDESNEEINAWVVNILLLHLENRRYNTCIPSRDFEFGGIHEESIRKNVRRSHLFVVILSDNYFKSRFTEIEWRQIWNMFKSDSSIKIIIINYDLIESSSVQNRNMRAFLRLGYFLDFSNMEKKLLKSIFHQLSN